MLTMSDVGEITPGACPETVEREGYVKASRYFWLGFDRHFALWLFREIWICMSLIECTAAHDNANWLTLEWQFDFRQYRDILELRVIGYVRDSPTQEEVPMT